MRQKLIRITTVPQSLNILLKGQLRYVDQNGFEVIGISAPGDALQEVHEREGIRTLSVKMTRTISPLRDMVALWQFYRICKREKPVIVHSHTPKAGIIGMLGAKLARVPVRMHTVAGLPLMEAKGRKRKLLDFVERLTYRCATKVYPNSRGLYNFIIAGNYTTAGKLKVIANGSSNGIDTSWFDPATVATGVCLATRKRLGINENDFVFLFVGRIVSDKGINELVAAFKTLNEIYIGSHLVLVGGLENDLDPLKPLTKQIIKDHTRIHSVGYINDVKEYFALADVLVFPSYREGFPNVVMQAGAMQLNSIVTDINGCNEIVTNGQNGWVVPAKDIGSLQERMEWCLLHQETSKRMGLVSRKLMQAKFEQRDVWEELLKEYRSFLGIGR